MEIRQPATTTEAIVFVGRNICPRRTHILAPLIKVDIGPKGRKKLCNDALESSFKELKRMISAETLISDPDWKMPFTVHTDASDKQLGAVFSQNKKYISFFSRRLSKPQRNYTTTEKEILVVVECLKKSRGIILATK